MSFCKSANDTKVAGRRGRRREFDAGAGLLFKESSIRIYFAQQKQSKVYRFQFSKAFQLSQDFPQAALQGRLMEDFMENSNMGKQHSSLAKADSKISSREVDPVVIPKELYQQVVIWPQEQRNYILPSLLLHVSFTIFSLPDDEEESNCYQDSLILNLRGIASPYFIPFPIFFLSLR